MKNLKIQITNQKEINKKPKNKLGFTLVELILTLLIISILAASAATRFLNLSDYIEAGACKTNQLSMKSAQTLYYTHTHLNGNGHYADELEELVPFLTTDMVPKCPSGGEYQILLGGDIQCSLQNHQR